MINNTISLWRAVILQAIIDSTSNYKRKEYQLEKKKAQSWLTNMNEDFKTVCLMAGYEPYYVQTKARNILHNQSKIKNTTTSKHCKYSIK